MTASKQKKWNFYVYSLLRFFKKKLDYYIVSLPLMQYSCKSKVPVNIIIEIRAWNFIITGIAGIHAIPINLKSLHTDFPVESL